MQKKYNNSNYIQSYILILVSPEYIYNYYYGQNGIEIERESDILGFEKEYKDYKYKVEDNILYVYLEI